MFLLIFEELELGIKVDLENVVTGLHEPNQIFTYFWHMLFNEMDAWVTPNYISQGEIPSFSQLEAKTRLGEKTQRRQLKRLFYKPGHSDTFEQSLLAFSLLLLMVLEFAFFNRFAQI